MSLHSSLPSSTEEATEISIQACDDDGVPSCVIQSINDVDDTKSYVVLYVRNNTSACYDNSVQKASSTLQGSIEAGDMVYKCSECEFSSVDKSSVVLHSKRHLNGELCEEKHEERTSHSDHYPHVCEECGYVAATPSGLNIHQFTHTGEKPLKCELCDFCTAYKSALKIHQRKHTREKPYVCDKCEYSATTQHCLQSHKKTHIGKNVYLCSVCDYRSARKKDLDQHRKKHSDELDNHPDDCGNIPKCSKDAYGDGTKSDLDIVRLERLQVHKKIYVGRKPYECEKCDYFSVDKYKFGVHQRIHTGDKPYQCDKCDFCSAYLSVIKVHQRSHTDEKSYKCDKCDYSTVTNSNLRLHKKIHTSEKPFLCDMCDYSSARKMDLKYHIRTHTSERPYKCDKCDYQATTLSQAKVHERIHTGIKPYKCDKCDYCSVQKYKITIHQIVHTGEKKFQCSKCKYRAAQKQKIKLHEERIHTRQQSVILDCPKNKIENECNISMIKKLIRNTKEAKLYKCEKCDFKSIQNYKIEIHQTIHPLETL